MIAGRTFEEIIKEISDNLKEDIYDLLRNHSLIDCPECGLWFTDNEYDCEQGDGCECHSPKCYEVFFDSANGPCICLELKDSDHKHDSNNTNNLPVRPGDRIEMDADGVLRYKKHIGETEDI